MPNTSSSYWLAAHRRCCPWSHTWLGSRGLPCSRTPFGAGPEMRPATKHFGEHAITTSMPASQLHHYMSFKSLPCYQIYQQHSQQSGSQDIAIVLLCCLKLHVQNGLQQMQKVVVLRHCKASCTLSIVYRLAIIRPMVACEHLR